MQNKEKQSNIKQQNNAKQQKALNKTLNKKQTNAK